jgi:hypothetical protein
MGRGFFRRTIGIRRHTVPLTAIKAKAHSDAYLAFDRSDLRFSDSL